MTVDRVRQVAITIATITPKTRWVFVTVELASGLHGLGEATASGHEDDIVAAFKRLAPHLLGKAGPALSEFLTTLPLTNLAAAAVISSLDQAAWDAVSRERGERLAEALVTDAPSVRDRRVNLYANINRRTRDRSPAGFVASACAAISAGHGAIKIAPFDEATPEVRRSGGLVNAMAPGIERIRAVRSSIGKEARLMVDCHWRLDVEATRRLVGIAAELDLYWIECPLPEAAEHLEDLRALRDYANARGVRLAGCEQMTRRQGFSPFLSAGTYDVIMPDVKYVGGLKELLALATDARRLGVDVSLHNPSGPVCHAVSLHACSAIDSTDLLEMQFDESPLFEKLQAPRLPSIDCGAAQIPDLPGMGLSLERATLAGVTELHWTCQ